MNEEKVVLLAEGNINSLGEDDANRVLESAIRDAREGACRAILGELKRITREIMGGKFSQEEVEALEKALVSVIGALNLNVQPEGDLRRLSAKFVDSDIKHLRVGRPKDLSFSDIQRAIICRLQGVDVDNSESDEELLSRMQKDSEGFAEMCRRFEESAMKNNKGE